jgi:hypothetical protein
MDSIRSLIGMPHITGSLRCRRWIIPCAIIAAVLAGCSEKSPEPLTHETPAGIVISADYATIEVGGAGTTIRAALFDENEEPLGEGHGVSFTITGAPSMAGEESPSFEHESSEDSVSHEVDRVTDRSGTASAELYSGTAPGPVTIKAVSLEDIGVFAEEHLVTIAVGGPAGIVLGAEESQIEAGGQSTTIHATVVDEFINNLGEGYGVRLEITEAPGHYGAERPSFEYPPSDDSISQVYEGITDADGRVEVELFSGYVFGWVRIRATLMDYENIPARELLILIEPGPPVFIDVSFGGPVQSSGDSLCMTLGVGLWDRYANPAGFGIPIYLEIEPDSIVAFENIIYSDSNGWASSPLAYTCEHSLDTIQLIVSAGSIADTTESSALPAYNPQIYISADPGAIWIEPPDTVGYSDITVQLLDGNGCEISNGIILFSALVCGEISGQMRDTTDSDGYAHTQFMIHIDDIPGPPPDPPQCTCGVRASLFGYPDVESEVEIICSRPR